MTIRQKPKVHWGAQADLTSFFWRVPETGFEWISTQQPDAVGTDWYLVVAAGAAIAASNAAVPHRPYDPLRESGLFRMFADLAPTRETVRVFADQFGFLGSDPTRHQPPTAMVLRPTGGNANAMVAGETLGDWRAEQQAVREAVTLWDATKGRTDGAYGTAGTPAKYLASVIKWSGSDAVSYAPARGQSFRIVSSDEPQLFRKFTPGDLVLPAQYALQRLVSRKLKDHASRANLLWDWQRTHPDLRIQLVPSSLISAIWLQLAMAIDGNRNYRRCESCTRWFELSGDARGDAKFCRQACRFKAYRDRQRRAREMADQHKSPREIAAELDTEVSTVKGWLNK